ncbi:MAG: hypothetical protein V1736_04735 [Pseudomonadota bacterium]
MESSVEGSEAGIARLTVDIEELEAEKKANDRRIFELAEKEIHHGEMHMQEIHRLKKRNFELAFIILTKRNEIKRSGSGQESN